LLIPSVNSLIFSVVAYGIFTALNIYGVRLAALVELAITVVAVTGLILFASISLPAASWENLSRNPLPNGISGVFAAIPFGVWFFLGIEGIANLAEETVNPNRTMSRGFLAALFTLILLCFTTFCGSVGAGGWEAVVLQPDGATSDAPLPMAWSLLRGATGGAYSLLIAFGLFGLVASFHGLMLAAGRSTLEFSRINFPKSSTAKIHSRTQTPVRALLLNSALGLLALFTGKTGEIITLSVFGALTLYILSMISVLVLRRVEPELPRPFRAPFFPLFPITALLIAALAIVALAVYNPGVAIVFVLIIAGCFGIFRIRKAPSA
jgi:ethanolamine permease